MKDKWTKEQIENFLRDNTCMMDDACKKLAGKLVYGIRINPTN